jgi:dipeptidase D
MTEVWKDQYRESEPELQVRWKDLGIGKEQFLTRETSDGVITFLYEVFNGIYTMSQDMPGLVESSSNLGVISMEEDQLACSFGVRSSVPELKEEIVGKICDLAESQGGSYVRESDYPAWEYKEDSLLREIFAPTFEEMYQKPLLVESIHAGLELAFLQKRFQGSTSYLLDRIFLISIRYRSECPYLL